MEIFLSEVLVMKYEIDSVTCTVTIYDKESVGELLTLLQALYKDWKSFKVKL